jgi:hypothetical protein
MTSTEPELEMVRRGIWFGPPAFVLALGIGAAAGGWDIGWSAAIGIAVVLANFVAHGVSLAWAARRSLTALAAVAMGGFIVRLGAIVAVMFLLNRLHFFSPLAFGLGSELRLPQKEAMTS